MTAQSTSATAACADSVSARSSGLIECPICGEGVRDIDAHLARAFHKPHTPTPLGYIDRHGRFVPLHTK